MNEQRYNCIVLENIYKLMNIKNKSSTLNDIIYDSTLNNNDSYKDIYCYAIYSLNNWYLNNSWRRLNDWLNKIVPKDNVVFYNVHPINNEGRLHQTLLQIIDFKNSNKYTKEDINKSLEICKNIIENNGFYMRIIYRGLVFTKTGIALAGYPYDSRDYDKLMTLRHTIESKLFSLNLPCSIPYKNDILHSTLLRWKSPISQDILDLLNNSIHRWDECVFGELRISNYLIGKASWKMLDHEREVQYNIHMPNIILHRGNNGNDTLHENCPNTLEKRDNDGYSVECDIWLKDDIWYLGHDYPEYKIENLDKFLSIPSRLIHAKDGNTFSKLMRYCRENGYNNEIFYHTNEDYVLTTSLNIVTYPGKYILENSILMMPENMNRDFLSEEIENYSSICSDFK